MAGIVEVDFAKPYFGDEERQAVNRVMAGQWLASGPENDAFEREFAELIGVPFALAVNSGSSANLLALAALDLTPESKVLTSGCGFPATLSPILHLGLEPVLVDYDAATHNISIPQVLEQLPFVDALILAHTMGNPVDMRKIAQAAHECGVYVIEDCCEAIGASLEGKQVGSWGDFGTYSFFPSHQITALGGGGMVVCKDAEFYHRMKSMRDWGKIATWDKGGQHKTTYSEVVDGIPYFSHYTYRTVGWNFKLPEANAAFGREQLKRLKWIVYQRRENHDLLSDCLGSEFAQVRVAPIAEPSWFGVILTLKEGNRDEFGMMLEMAGVRHRPFFAGNITRHPPFARYRKNLPVADWLMKQSCFVGCWAGLTASQIAYMIDTIRNAVRKAERNTVLATAG